MPSTRDVVLEYLHAIETHELARVAELLHPEVEVVEHPNKLNPSGKRYNNAEIRAAGERGATLMAREEYKVRALTIEGERAVAQIAWLGVLHDGREMRAHICSVIELREGRVWRQEQYDCFES